MRVVKNGFSLVELLVAMVIGLFLVGGVVSVLIDSKDHFLMEQETALIQENARFAIEEVAYDIRMAGYSGCSVAGEFTNTLNDTLLAANNKWMYSSNGIKGYERGSGAASALFPAAIAADTLIDTDVVVINRGEPSDNIIVTSHVPTLARINVNDASVLEPGSILLMASAGCKYRAIFQMTGPATPTTNIENQSPGTPTPGNCSSALTNASSNGYDCSASPGAIAGRIFPAGSALMRFRSNAYFIKNSTTTGLPALYRETLYTNAAGNAATQAQELISGVEDFQLLYGVDTDPTADGVANRYFNADSITIDTVDIVTPNYVAWERVMSVQLTLLMRSSRPVFPSGTTITIDVDKNGTIAADETFTDGLLRQVISTTVDIRNRGLGL